MIWFACGQCGKLHGRPESAVGSLVFCECGHGNRVPWESTASPPDPAAEPAVPAVVLPAQPPKLAPVPVGEERLPVPPPRPARRVRSRRRDPERCFNHPELPSEATCADCQENFCKQCVTQLEDKVLCGPCKNYRFRVLARPPRVSGMAIAGVIVALIGAPLALFIVLPLTAAGANPFLALAIGLTPQLVAGLLGGLALRTTFTNPRLAGQALAVTAVVTAVTSCLLLGALAMLSYSQWL
jgi:hypothetical protein